LTSSALVTSPPSYRGVFLIRNCAVDAILSLCFNLSMQTDAYIAIGSNMGDRELNLLRAVAEISRLPDGKVTGLSSFYETSPVGVTEQPSFYNAVLRLHTALSPHELLERLLGIEIEIFGRSRTTLWGPRRMDLDLLLYGDDRIDEGGLVVPHPRMAERRFVLQPLCDIAPDLVHPVLGASIFELLGALRSDETVTRI
jgi:2-amino-4-hydroxy-6-hydroxymethyldihydropteridine diphosphokinase